MKRARSSACSLLLILIFLLSGATLGQEDSPPGTPTIDLSGTWAEMQVYSQYSTFPMAGRVRNVTTVVLRVRIEQTGSALILNDTYCATTIDNGTILASTVIPDAFLSSLVAHPRSATLEQSEDGLRFAQEWYTEIRGVRLDDPENDPLPTTAEDPRVFDQDGDGKPGMTVRSKIIGLFSGETYVVQRVHYRLIGTITSSDTIEGVIEWTNEQITIGASSDLFGRDIRPTTDPVVENSHFVLKRIDPETDCETLKETWKELFAG